jgi:hypothetical protein
VSWCADRPRNGGSPVGRTRWVGLERARAGSLRATAIHPTRDG